mmetsp:Transcript_9798/g.29839  ORF Transcript_9798/g.29839 Transcript_9798/m.29839 type:complete len:123 (+) Transcript_9798:148-516(+)
MSVFDTTVSEFFVSSSSHKTLSEKISRTSSKNSSDGTISCQYCGKPFKKHYSLKLHLRNHTGEMPFRCGINGCQLRFKWRSSLMNHRRYHLPKEIDSGTEMKLKGGRRTAKLSSVTVEPKKN